MSDCHARLQVKMRELAPWWIVACLAILPAGLEAAIGHSRLEVEGGIEQVLPGDLDGDGRRDLLVFHIVGRGRGARRSASVFWQRPESGFPPAADLSWELPAQEVALDLYEGEGFDRPRSRWSRTPAVLYALRRDGIYRYRFRRAPAAAVAERLIEADFRHLAADRDRVLVIDFARRWIGDEVGFLVPTLLEPTLFHNSAGRFEALSVPVPAEVSHGLDGMPQAPGQRLAARYRQFLPVGADQDGDGTIELVLFDQERVVIVAVPPPARRGGRAEVQGDYPVEIFRPEESFGEAVTVLPRLADLDGDGRADLLVTIFRDFGLFDLKGRMMVFRGRADGSFPARADQTLEVDSGQYYLTLLEDVDGDGRIEILVPAAKIGVFGFIKLLTRHRVSFQLNVFEQRAESSFGPGREVPPRLLALVSDRYDLSAVMLAEVNGDGVRDLILGAPDDQICVREGALEQAGWRLSGRPDPCFAGDPFARLQAADLDGDGRDELLEIGLRGEARSRLRVTFFHR